MRSIGWVACAIAVLVLGTVAVASHLAIHPDVMGSVARSLQSAHSDHFVYEHRPVTYSAFIRLLSLPSALLFPTDVVTSVRSSAFLYLAFATLVFSPVLAIKRLEPTERVVIWLAMITILASTSYWSFMQSEQVAAVLGAGGVLIILSRARYGDVAAAALFAAAAFLKYVTILVPVALLLGLLSMGELQWERFRKIVLWCILGAVAWLAFTELVFDDFGLAMFGNTMQSFGHVTFAKKAAKLLSLARVEPHLFFVAAYVIATSALCLAGFVRKVGGILSVLVILAIPLVQTPPFYYHGSAVLALLPFCFLGLIDARALVIALLATVLVFCAAWASTIDIMVLHAVYADLVPPVSWPLASLGILAVGVVFLLFRPSRMLLATVVALSALPLGIWKDTASDARWQRVEADMDSVSAYWAEKGIPKFSDQILYLGPSHAALVGQQGNDCAYAYSFHMQRVGATDARTARLKNDPRFEDIVSCYRRSNARFVIWNKKWLPTSSLRRLSLAELVSGQARDITDEMVIVDRGERRE